MRLFTFLLQVLNQYNGFNSWNAETNPVSYEDILRSVVPTEQLARYDSQGPKYFMDHVVSAFPPPKVLPGHPPRLMHLTHCRQKREIQ